MNLSALSGMKVGLAGLLLALAACATGPQARVDYDRAADFSLYKTFAFASPLGTDRDGYESVISQHLKAASQRQMEARGYRLDTSNPQLLINFNANLSDKLRVSTTPAPTVARRGYYGYRSNMYTTWPVYADQTTVTQYKEGTLNIDLIDSARKQLVWEGVVTESVTQKTLDNVQAAIDLAVAAAFAKYPVKEVAAAK